MHAQALTSTRSMRATAPLLFETPATKHCKVCKGHRLLAEFLPHAGSRDGRRAVCRGCQAAGLYVPKSETPAQRARRKERQSRPEWQASHSRALKLHASRNPIAAAATRAVQEAVRLGTLRKAKRCQVRGCTSNHWLEAHHHSYHPSKWLDVLWCCASHHRRGHAQGFIVPRKGLPAHMGTIPEKPDAQPMRLAA